MDNCVFGTEYDYDTLRDKALLRIHRDLKETRAKHSVAVAKLAVELAERHCANKRKAEIAGILHDIARNMAHKEMNKRIKEQGLDRRYINNRNLAHSKLAVQIMKDDFGISDREILDAVSYHTTGRAGMTVLDMIIFLADATEPAREYPGVDMLRTLRDINLAEACLYSLNRTVEYVKAAGFYPDPDTVSALEYYKREIGR